MYQLKQLGRSYNEDFDDHFAYIAGYTSGDFAYGVTHEKMKKIGRREKGNNSRE